MEYTMSLTKENAKQILNKAFAEAKNASLFDCKHKQFIDFVIDNTHLTYKYILFTALLSKATDANINPLCLQKGSSLIGAYDARSICHSVIVPFEIEVLDKALGGSNEPFLNKPARFPELSLNNAVRKGRDKEILVSLCENLPTIKTKEDAFSCLVYLLCKLDTIKKYKENLLDLTLLKNDCSKTNLYKLVLNIMQKSCEGETLTLVVAGLYHLLYKNNIFYRIEMHPVNQCGASSKEISDLDIYVNNILSIPIELKDKAFSHIDVKHAADKVILANCQQLLFIMGLNSKEIDTEDIINLVNNYIEKGFFINIVPIMSFVKNIITLLENINIKDFINYTLQQAKNKKFKEETIRHLVSSYKQYFSL